MKKLFRLPVLLYVFIAGLAVTQVACSNAEQKEAERESEQAYADFKDYVNTAGNEIDTAMTDVNRDWDNEMSQKRAAYKEREDRVNQHMESYDEKRQQEINQMRTSYQENWDRQEMAYEKYNKRNQLRNKLYGVEVKGNDLSAITPSNIRSVYESFVTTVQENQQNYTMEEWRNIESYWEALQDRQDEIEDQISTSDRAEMAKERTKYSAIKNKNKINIQADDTGTSLKETGKDTRSTINEKADKVGGKIENTGKKAIENIRD